MERSIRGAPGPLPAAGAAARSSEEGTATFEAVVAPLYPYVLRRLVMVLGDPADAEDVAQEAYLRAFRAWEDFRRNGRDPRAWLYTIALRLAFDGLRRRRRWTAIVRGPGARAAYEDRADPDLWAALGGLEPRVRAALLANVLDGYTQREIAAMLGVPEGTVASWLSRARSSLREALADE